MPDDNTSSPLGQTNDDNQQLPGVDNSPVSSTTDNTTDTPTTDMSSTSTGFTPISRDTDSTNTSDAEDSSPVMPAEPVSEAVSDISNNSSGSDLADIKKRALEQLTPIVGKLDQTPEEKFQTTMMMIQASDNQSLIKDAYEAAQLITDEKAKAQALLDVVNEINYFSQNADSSK